MCVIDLVWLFRWRGLFGTIFQVFIVTGILFMYSVGVSRLARMLSLYLALSLSLSLARSLFFLSLPLSLSICYISLHLSFALSRSLFLSKCPPVNFVNLSIYIQGVQRIWGYLGREIFHSRKFSKRQGIYLGR